MDMFSFVCSDNMSSNSETDYQEKKASPRACFNPEAVFEDSLEL